MEISKDQSAPLVARGFHSAPDSFSFVQSLEPQPPSELDLLRVDLRTLKRTAASEARRVASLAHLNLQLTEINASVTESYEVEREARVLDRRRLNEMNVTLEKQVAEQKVALEVAKDELGRIKSDSLRRTAQVESQLREALSAETSSKMAAIQEALEEREQASTAYVERYEALLAEGREREAQLEHSDSQLRERVITADRRAEELLNRCQLAEAESQSYVTEVQLRNEDLSARLAACESETTELRSQVESKSVEFSALQSYVQKLTVAAQQHGQLQQRHRALLHWKDAADRQLADWSSFSAAMHEERQQTTSTIEDLRCSLTNAKSREEHWEYQFSLAVQKAEEDNRVAAQEDEHLRSRLEVAEAAAEETEQLRSRLQVAEATAQETEQLRSRLQVAEATAQETEGLRSRLQVAEATAQETEGLRSRLQVAEATAQETEGLRSRLQVAEATAQETEGLRSRLQVADATAQETEQLRCRLQVAEATAQETERLRSRLQVAEATAQETERLRSRLQVAEAAANTATSDLDQLRLACDNLTSRLQHSITLEDLTMKELAAHLRRVCSEDSARANECRESLRSLCSAKEDKARGDELEALVESERLRFEDMNANLYKFIEEQKIYIHNLETQNTELRDTIVSMQCAQTETHPDLFNLLGLHSSTTAAGVCDRVRELHALAAGDEKSTVRNLFEVVEHLQTKKNAAELLLVELDQVKSANDSLNLQLTQSALESTDRMKELMMQTKTPEAEIALLRSRLDEANNDLQTSRVQESRLRFELDAARSVENSQGDELHTLKGQVTLLTNQAEELDAQLLLYEQNVQMADAMLSPGDEVGVGLAP
ncbi:MAG: hypothetical protein KVP17_004802 [Porospora cf. gigantea B]|uniref:uncharacterized protein n=1 Tax=Porospora cf. gigantea B TaxID=2853592 RepID=UPI003571D1D7|nr:MAG: hypothetical protein KVP17_004802 [Porospora cf. gigantea B]